MQYIQLTESSAKFTLTDLIKKVGEEKASSFLISYRHACTLLDDNYIIIKCYNLGELLARFFANDYAEEEKEA